MQTITKVALDAMGGDNAPAEIVKGAVDAVSSREDIKVFLVGQEDVVREELQKYPYPQERIEVVDAPEVIEMVLRGGGKGGRTGCCNHRTGGHGGRQRNRHCFRLGERENRQFQLNALVRTAGHLFQRGAKRIDSAYRFRLGEIFPRSVGSFLFGGSSRQQVGAAGQGAEHQIAVMPGQLHTKAAHIHALLAQGAR